MRGVSVDVGGLSVAPEAGSKANDQNSQNGAQPHHTTEFCNRIEGEADMPNVLADFRCDPKATFGLIGV
jgi:hypothetical protein